MANPGPPICSEIGRLRSSSPDRGQSRCCRGKLLWQQEEETGEPLPATLAVSGGRVFFQGTDHLIGRQTQALQITDRRGEISRVSIR